MYLLCSEGSPHKDVPSVTNAMTISVGQDGEPVEQGTDKIQRLSTTEENFTVSNTSEDLDLNSPHKDVPSVTNAMAIGVGQDGEPVEQGTDKIQRLSTTEENFTVSNTSEDLDLNSPHKDVPSVTNAMAIGVGQDGEPVEQGTDKIQPFSMTEENFTVPDTSEDLDLNSQPLHLPDTYNRLDAIKPTDPTDVYDELEPQQLLHPANDDKPPPSNTCYQLPSANITYDRLIQMSKFIPHDRLSEESFTVSDTSKDLDLNSQPLHPPDTYNRMDAIKPTDPTDVYDELEPQQLLHPANDDKPPPSNTCDQLPSANITYGRLIQMSKTIPRNRLSTSNTPRTLCSNIIHVIVKPHHE